MIALLSRIIYPFFESAFRRAFGSDGWNVPIIKIRAVQHALNILGTSVALYSISALWWQIATIPALLTFWLWGSSHGDYFSVNDTSVDEGRVKWIDWTLKKIYGDGNYYNFKGNATGMFLRYTAPAIVISAISFNFWFLFAGFSVVCSYCLMAKLFPTKPYTELAEWIAGFVVGFLLTL